MEYTQENHIATKILKTQRSDIDFNNFKRSNFTITGNMNLEPVKINYKGEECWIKKAELEILNENNINVDDIYVSTYVEGMFSPYTQKGSPHANKTIDGYQLHILH